ncbi:NAD(P)H quinone oxidoreductase [Chitiniphilus shinanonensis]|uniref:NAD(P)H quinone oxidoreductase n=1 Tax=Chitiniphilus shinanonensis TaxID=553088 RepID=A0ABQ6BR97_9NEIS|nr:NAD(P)H-quinone oxidoreductase [Chitiniphilus shinanonensis]GLS04326.1 NAD(P)H quinone oxidoreductase [Chitiniphilus shinanonensis]
MRAILPPVPGQPLTVGEFAPPVPQAGQLLVRVRAAGVNRADLAQAAGHYPPPRGESPLLGLEIAGEVAALGEGVDGYALGDAVFGLVAGGGYAEYCVIDAGETVPLPAALGFEQAASLPEVWLTAWLNLVELGGLRPGGRVLVHAGASGVGAAAIQLARAHGAWVAATAGGDAKCAWCRELGADLVIDHRAGDFAAEVKAAGEVGLILDTVGGDYLPRNQACLATDGRIVLIGLLRGTEAQANLGLLLVKRQQLIGSTLRALPVARKAEVAAALWPWLLPRLAAGEIRLTLDRVFALEEAAEAHAYLAQNRNLGKVVLRVD